MHRVEYSIIPVGINGWYGKLVWKAIEEIQVKILLLNYFLIIMTVTIEIMGGLGNQLFQIFTLISYSIKSQSPFYFENKYITCGVRKKYYWDTPLLNTLQGFIKPHLQEPLLIYQEPFFHYTLIPIVNEEHKNIKLNGYFQSYKYFEEHKEVILKMINLKETQQQIKEKITCYLPTTEF